MSSQQTYQRPAAIVDTLVASEGTTMPVRLTLAEEATVLSPSCNNVSYTVDSLGERSIVATVTQVKTEQTEPFTARLTPHGETISLPESVLVATAPHEPEGAEDTFERPTLSMTVTDPPSHLADHTNLPHKIGPIAAVEFLE